MDQRLESQPDLGVSVLFGEEWAGVGVPDMPRSLRLPSCSVGGRRKGSVF